LSWQQPFDLIGAGPRPFGFRRQFVRPDNLPGRGQFFELAVVDRANDFFAAPHKVTGHAQHAPSQ